MGEPITVQCPACTCVLQVHAFVGKDHVQQCVACKYPVKITKVGDGYRVQGDD